MPERLRRPAGCGAAQQQRSRHVDHQQRRLAYDRIARRSAASQLRREKQERGGEIWQVTGPWVQTSDPIRLRRTTTHRTNLKAESMVNNSTDFYNKKLLTDK